MTANHDYTIRYRTDKKTKETKAEIFTGDTKAYGTVWCATEAGARAYAMDWLAGKDARSITEEAA